ncbi:MAG: cytochrome C, partial [Rhodobacteraceae bacterium]
MRGLIALICASLPSLGAAEGFFTLKGHGGPIMGIAVSPQGRIATASFDNSVGLWDGLIPVWLEGHEAAVNAVLWHDGVLYSAGDDFTIRRWPGGAVIGRHKGKVTELAAHGQTIASASWDGTIGLWSPEGARSLSGHQSGVNDLAFSADGTRLYSAGTDGSLRLWDVATGTETRQLLNNGFGINELILNEDAGWIAYGAIDGVTRVIDADTARPIADFTLERRPILAMALSPDAGL